MKTKIAPIKRPIEAKKYPKNTDAPYNNPPKTGPKIVPDCQATALKATASGKSFLSTIFARKAAAAGEKNALTIPIPIKIIKRTIISGLPVMLIKTNRNVRNASKKRHNENIIFLLKLSAQ